MLVAILSSVTGVSKAHQQGRKGKMIDKGILPSEKTLSDLNKKAHDEIQAGKQKLLDL